MPKLPELGYKKLTAAGPTVLNGTTAIADAGDKYTGLDRFGRLVETLWKAGATELVRSKYGRRRFGGITWRRDEKAHAEAVTTEDNFYSYDEFYQVKEHQRGTLGGTAWHHQQAAG